MEGRQRRKREKQKVCLNTTTKHKKCVCVYNGLTLRLSYGSRENKTQEERGRYEKKRTSKKEIHEREENNGAKDGRGEATTRRWQDPGIYITYARMCVYTF